MANKLHVAQLRKGVKAWDRWRRSNFMVDPDLKGADLRGFELAGGNFGGADLRGADLRGVDIGEAFFWEADLCASKLNKAVASRAFMVGAKLRKANLTLADFHDADLGGADLSYAVLKGSKLDGVIFSGTDLDFADFTNAEIGLTHFADVDLSRARGLDAVVHAYPSDIGIATVYKSKGQIPLRFLRGCGIPENFIDYMSSLVGTGIEFCTLFISYSTEDEEFAQRLYSDLQANGVRCWFAPHNMRGGKKTYRQIDEAIRMYDRLLLVLSQASMASEWVRTEIALARKKEKEQGKEVLFPITLCPFPEIRKWEYFDSDIGKDSAREIREYHIPDFTCWKDHDVYRKAFDRLLADLKGKP